MLLGGGSKDDVLEEAGIAVAGRGWEVEKYGGFSGRNNSGERPQQEQSIVGMH